MPRDAEFKTALRLAFKDAEANEHSKRTLRKIAEALIDEAIKGNVPAIKEVADRLDGKPAQTILGDGDSPLIVQVVQFTEKNPG